MNRDDHLTPELTELDHRLRQAVADTAADVDLRAVDTRLNAHLRRPRGWWETSSWAGRAAWTAAVAALPVAAAALLAVGLLHTPPPPAPRTAVAPSPSPSPAVPYGALLPGQPLKLIAVRMVDESHGWSVDWQDNSHGVVLRTDDGGSTWTNTTPPADHSDVPAWYFLDARRAWVLLQQPHSPLSTLYRTDDGGASWQTSALPSIGASGAYDRLEFTDARHGWLFVGDWNSDAATTRTGLWATTDGGVAWSQVWQSAPIPAHSAPCLQGVSFADTSTGWMWGDDGCAILGIAFLQVTHDGGRSWAPQPLGLSDVLGASAPIFTTGVDGTLIVRRGPAASKGSSSLLVTHDRGGHWSVASLPAGLIAVPQFRGPRLGFALTGTPDPAGRYIDHLTLQRTTDGGLHWTPVATDLFSGARDDGKGIGPRIALDFLDEQTGWITNVPMGSWSLRHSTDGGLHWSTLHPHLVDNPLP